jgi:hypothetical protein
MGILSSIAVLGAMVLAGRPAVPVPLTTYTDAANGVRFQYPAVWTRSSEVVAYLPSYLTMDGSTPTAVLQFSGKGNVYEKTNFDSLSFIYLAVPGKTQAECHELGEMKDENEKPPQTVVIHGVAYRHASGGDAGMSHDLSIELYSTWRSGTCLLFEEDLRNIAPGVIDGARALTPLEFHALQRHLDRIMQSVTLNQTVRQP